MRMKKVYITLLIILFVFFLVMFCLFGIDNIRQGEYSSILIVSIGSSFFSFGELLFSIIEGSLDIDIPKQLIMIIVIINTYRDFLILPCPLSSSYSN